MQTEPEQWAEELYVQVHNLIGVEAIAAIQRAFEDQTRKLREALKEIRDNRTELNDRSDYARGWNDARFCLKNIAHQALKETPDAG